MKYHSIRNLLLLLIITSLFFSCKKTETGDLIISNIEVVDVEKGITVQGQDIIINGDKIKSIIPHGTTKLQSEQIVDGTGKYIIPGLWDMHAHIRAYSHQDNLPMFIYYGITGIRDLGITNHELIKHWKGQIKNKEIVGPTIISSGVIIEGASARFPSSVVINEMEDVIPTIDSLIAKKIQVVKLFQNIPSDVFKEIIRYAKEKSIVTSGHIPPDMNQIDAAEAGLGSIEHLFNIGNTLPNYENYNFTEEQIQTLAASLVKNETFECPTMVNLEYFVKLGEAAKDSLVGAQLFEDNPKLKLTPAYFRAWWAAIKSRNMENFTEDDYTNFKQRSAFNGKIISKLHDLGVKILAGTDVPNPYILTGISLHEELEQFVKGGMSPSDALKTATLYPAQYFKHDTTLGQVANNFIADLVILDANPLENISNTQRIHAVVYNGQLHSKEALNTIKSNQIIELANYKTTDFDQYIYMDVRRNGIDAVRKKYPIVENNEKYTIEKHHLIRLSEALKDGLQPEEAVKALEWNKVLFPEDS
ncbi:amidohydrolase family protein [Flavobacteriaceae bacterium R38]|nr:amidohydrolase family protein [Flavobacteriaceae bacterium R38]